MARGGCPSKEETAMVRDLDLVDPPVVRPKQSS